MSMLAVIVLAIVAVLLLAMLVAGGRQAERRGPATDATPMASKATAPMPRRAAGGMRGFKGFKVPERDGAS